MKTSLTLVILITLLIFMQGILFAQNSSATSDANLVFEEEKYDFGEVSNDTILTHVFKFENTGTDTLYISGVRGS